MRKVIAIAVLLVFDLRSIASSQESISTDVLQRVKAASVFVKVTLGPLEYSGSGFVIAVDAESVLIVTNAHVVGKPDFLKEQIPLGLRGRDRLDLQRIQAAIQNLEPIVNLVFRSGTADEQVVPCVTVALDKVHDLAILRAVKVRTAPTPIPLDIDFRPTETTPVFTFGFPFGESISETKGNPAITVGRGAISSVRLDEKGEESTIQIDGALNPGNSGGPVVDVKGRLVGVAVATIRGSGIGFAIPPSTLQRLLSGSVSKIVVTSKKNEDELAVEFKLELLDPFHKIRKLSVCCRVAETKAATPDASHALDGDRIEVALENGKGAASWRIPQPAADKSTLFLQAILIDAEGHERRLPATRHRLFVQEGTYPAPGIPIRRGPFSLMRPQIDEVHRDSILARLNQQDPDQIKQALDELIHFDPAQDTGEIGTSLEQLLSHADDSIRAASAKLIGTWGSKAHAEAVLKLLEDSVANVRHSAMHSLAGWRFADAVATMIIRLRFSEDRNFAKQSLIRFGSGAETKVIECLNDNELAVRLAACEILAEIGSTDVAVPALKRLTQQDTGLIGLRAREAIERIIARTTMPLDFPVGVTNSVNRKVHMGLPNRQGEMLLTEGLLVFGDKGQAIGLGIMQTGPETMEFTYLAVIRLPRGNISQTTFASRKKTVNNRIRVSHSAYLGDESLIFEHAYRLEILPFEEEDFFIQDVPFSAKNGRLFFVDISGAEPVVVQRNVDLPLPGPLVALTNTTILELSDRVLNELIKQNEEVRGFVNGAKLVERPVADR